MSVFAQEWDTYAEGRQAARGALDADLEAKLRDYRRKVARRYRVVFPEKIERYLPEGDDLWISTKIDGELWFLVKQDGECALCAYNGRVLQGVPVVEEAAEHLEGVDDIIVAGELFAIPIDEDARPRVGHVRTALHDDELAATLGFRAFDLLEDGDDEQLRFADFEKRYERLDALFGQGRRCALMTTQQGDRAQAAAYYQEWVDSGKFEGLVVRTSRNLTYKIKPRLTLDAVIVAFGERIERGRTEVRELTVALMRDDGTYHVLGTVGNGFDHDERAAWHKRLAEMVVPSEYRLANRDGTLCRFVRPEIVVEVKVSDLVETDTRANPVRQMALAYDEEQGFRPLGPLPLVSMLHPVLVGERADKVVEAHDIGLDQIYRHVPFSDREATAEATELPDTEIIDRRVFRKEMRGGAIGVRKYVAVATNKSEINPDYAPFAVTFTDYSSGRKSPMKTDLRIAPTEEALCEHIDVWIDKNIKRGWEEVE